MNLWERWWRVFITKYDDIKEVWLQKIMAGQEILFLDYIEEVRQGFFKGAEEFIVLLEE